MPRTQVKRRRILVTPSDQAWALIDELHQLSKEPRAAIVAELMDVAAPAFEGTLRALRMAKESPREAQRLLASFANEKVGELMQAQLDLDSKITELDGRTVQGKRAKRKGVAGGAGSP